MRTKALKKIIYPILSMGLGFILLINITACEDLFLDQPMITDLSEEDVFSDWVNARGAVAQAYSVALLSGLPGEVNWEGNYQQFREGTIDLISGEGNATKLEWTDAYNIQRGGFRPEGGPGSRALTEDGFDYNYQAIRHCFIVKENIDKVTDLTEIEKEQIKGEMKALIAYRYKEMLKRYGGVPLVKQALSVEDEILIPRASVQETVDYIVELSEEAAAVLPDNYPEEWEGRATKGVALSNIAEVLIYAARPLFNSNTPYSSNIEDVSVIHLGGYDANRWQDAADAAKNVIDWADQNGYGIINTGNPLDDYGTAVATPGNNEVLFAYKNQWEGSPLRNVYNPRQNWMATNGMSFYQLQQYYKEDGTDQDWPEPGSGETRPYQDYYDRIHEMEARYKASAQGAGIDAWNNPNDDYWAFRNVIASSGGVGGIAQREACGIRVKFWYKAGTRDWFEFPLYRLAQFYLYAAEAYNELDEQETAHDYLDVIRDRAGLPDVIETDQTTLREIIQREWAVEFYMEMNRLFDVRHWKLNDIDNGIIGGSKHAFHFHYIPGRNDARLPEHYEEYEVREVYEAFWANNQYLHPIPAYEVNKGYILQNPEY